VGGLFCFEGWGLFVFVYSFIFGGEGGGLNSFWRRKKCCVWGVLMFGCLFCLGETKSFNYFWPII